MRLWWRRLAQAPRSWSYGACSIACTARPKVSSGAKTQKAPIPIQHEVLRPLLQEARLFVLEHDQLFVVVSSDSS